MLGSFVEHRKLQQIKCSRRETSRKHSLCIWVVSII